MDIDIWIGSLESGSARPILDSRFYEGYPELSPNGRWLAYSSNESGRSGVYVRPYPGPGAQVPISTAGGWAPTWSGDGRELFYRSSTRKDGKWISRMHAVEITVKDGELRPGNPVVLFEGRYFGSNPIRSYDVRRDGQRFLMVRMATPEERQARHAGKGALKDFEQTDSGR